MRRLLLLSLLCAASASANVGPARWKALPPNYRIFNHTSVPGTADFAQVRTAVQSGFARWQAPACTDWDSNYAGGFSTPTGPAAVVPNDRLNRVLWIEADAWERDAFHGSQVLALTSVSRPCTTTACTQYTDEIVDADMEFNGQFEWVLTPAGSYDVHIESIATHEAGHFAGILHTPDATATVMTPNYNFGTFKVSLHPLDERDICTMYPAPGTVGQGSTCETDTECGTDAPACRGPSGATSKICTTTCTGESDTSCADGYVCRAANTGFACLFPIGATDLCEFCTRPGDCSNSLCASDGRHNWCTNYCLTASDCGANYDCVPYGATGRSVCQPKADNCAEDQCTTEANCPIGYTCDANRMCSARGTVDSRCELSGYCDPCTACVGNVNEAYCRPCCEGSGSGGICNTCTDVTCSSTYACTELSNQLDSVCMPAVGSPACGACDGNTPCQDGLTCWGGFCRVSCNPEAPGNCVACQATGSGAGVCACSGEVAIAGQSCGQSSGANAICLNEDRCVGSPPVCRTQCEAGVPESCRAGEECQQVSGEDVCVPVEVSGQRCSPCENSTCAEGLQCVAGRCLEMCDVSAPVCQACVPNAGLEGFCACPDSISPLGGACGYLAGQVRGCAPGYSCIEGTCNLRCDPAAPQCPPGSACQEVDGQNFCIADVAPDAGQPALPPPPPTRTTDVGCGCSSSNPASSVLWMLGTLLPWMAMRRRSIRPRR